MPETLRAFIAVPMPDAVTAFLKDVQTRLRANRLNIRWVPAQNVHLTLKFLGDIDPSMVPEIAVRMDTAAGTMRPFSIAPGGVGIFPNFRQARVVWVGLTGDIDRLHQLHEALSIGLEEAGFAREKRAYRAHLTVGRTRQRIPAQDLIAMLAPLQDAVSDPFKADRLALYQSTLKPAGAQYDRLHTSTLAG